MIFNYELIYVWKFHSFYTWFWLLLLLLFLLLTQRVMVVRVIGATTSN